MQSETASPQSIPNFKRSSASTAEQAEALDAELRRRAEAGIDAINAEIAALNEHHREAIQEVAARFNVEQQSISAELEAVGASVLDGIEWPEPEEDAAGEPPLFDSMRGYVEQIDHYKRYQGKPTTHRRRQPHSLVREEAAK
jgi:hypothetical protein